MIIQLTTQHAYAGKTFSSLDKNVGGRGQTGIPSIFLLKMHLLWYLSTEFSNTWKWLWNTNSLYVHVLCVHVLICARWGVCVYFRWEPPHLSFVICGIMCSLFFKASCKIRELLVLFLNQWALYMKFCEILIGVSAQILVNLSNNNASSN